MAIHIPYHLWLMAILEGSMKAKLNNLIVKYENQVDMHKRNRNRGELEQLQLELVRLFLIDLRKLKGE